MPNAVKRDEVLGAPSVGSWTPAVQEGGVLATGELLGVLVRLGRSLPVTVPPGISGRVAAVTAPGTWVAYGEPLATWSARLDAVEPEEGPAEVEGAAEGVAVRTDTDGTVYLRPEPGAACFVAEGASVSAQETLALVEVMKTFTPVRAPSSGRVVRVDVADGDPVTEGDVLFWIMPA